LTESGFLSDNGSYSYANDIENLPMVLDEDGYLQAGVLNDNGYLQDNGLSYDVGYFQPGFGMDNVNF